VLKNLFHLPQSKYRLWAILGAFALGIGGVFLGSSVVAAIANQGTALSVPGGFFVRAYGVLAVFIPAYFLYAAFLLAERQYKPKSIYNLVCFIIPFFTLSLGVFWIREIESLSAQSPFIAAVGRGGIVVFVLFVLAVEFFLITVLRRLLFSSGEAGKKVDTAREKPKWAGQKMANLKLANQKLADQNPLIQEEADLPPGTSRFPKPKSLRDIYAEAAAAMSVDTGNPLLSAVPDVLPFTPAAEKSAFSEPEILEESREVDVMTVMPRALETADSQSTDRKAEAFQGDDDVEKALDEAAAYAAENREPQARLAREPMLRARRRLPYSIPVDDILRQYPDGEYWIIDEETREAALTLKETLKEFSIQIEVTGIRKGPVITMFEILPAPGIRLARIEGLADNIALRLAAQSVRIVAPIPGKHAVGIEVPNARRNIVSFREIIETELSRAAKKSELPAVLGKDITGEAVTVDLVQMPHLLIAGATGSGKSVCVNAMILSILYQKPPSECRLILIDPKIVELKLYNDIPHLLTPVITESKKAFQALQYCIYEMERRYACLDSLGVRDIRSYNRRIKERNIATESMPYIVVVIDEFADLMATTGKELESTVARLAAMSRAVGIHLVLATQRPSIDVITGLIKANIPSRIAFMVASKMDSRIIIDMVGAEKLLGKGDMLYAGVVDPFPIRMQGAFVSEEEVERVVDYVKTLGEPDYIDEEIFFDDDDDNADPSLFADGDDPLYDKALEIVVQQGKASASYIQRRLKIGYNRAARIVEMMEHHGLVGPAQGSKPRELLRAP